ncbi:MAG TPA: hypothetical protein PKZ55_03710, partial [Verrucomicrobiota bacterium]|nr:hypothetical protein [Verrucomicrobiota bacterium]
MNDMHGELPVTSPPNSQIEASKSAVRRPRVHGRGHGAASGRSASASAVSAEAGPATVVSGMQWLVVLAAGAIAALASTPLWHDFSPWAGLVAALLAMTVLHMGYSCGSVVALPHLAVIVCLAQYGIAPWGAYYYPANNPVYLIEDFAHYFSYAGPALLAITLGWIASCFGLRPSGCPISEGRRAPVLVRELDCLLWGGIALKLAFGSAQLGGLSFLILLLANLRFLAAIGLMLLGAPGWRWRIALLFVSEIILAVEATMFHELVLWTLGFFVTYLFVRRPRMPVFLTWLVLLCAGVFFLHDAKWQFRQGSARATVFGEDIPLTKWNSPLLGGLCLVQSTTKALTGGYSDDSVGEMIVRFNQGWIIDRILHHVPSVEPYARGRTIISAFEAAMLPRILAPNKQFAGGREFMQCFAGYTLTEGTSMNLGFGGELYANFGYWGGILGCGLYALVLGLGFRWVARRAHASPIWWAILVYVGHWALKAETDIGAVLNYIVKAAIVACVAAMCLPAVRAELAGRPVTTSRPSRRGWEVKTAETRKCWHVSPSEELGAE